MIEYPLETKMNNYQIWLKGMLSYILIDVCASSIFKLTEIILFFFGIDFLIIIITKGIIYVVLMILIYMLFINSTSIFLNITFKAFTISILLGLIFKYVSSYYSIELRIIKIDVTPYFANLVGIDQIITNSFSLVLIMLIIIRFYQVSQTTSENLLWNY